MTILIRREPQAQPVQNLSRLMNQFFGDPFFSTPFHGLSVDEGTLDIDLSEDDRSVIVRASLPGFRKEDVTIEAHDGVLAIKAEHTDEQETTNEKYYRKERRFGLVSRRVALPSEVIEGETTAELKDGVLTVRMPKPAKSTPRKIAIN